MLTSPRAVTVDDLEQLLPDAAVEVVGDRRELVIYTGLTDATYDPTVDVWTPTGGRLVPMPEGL